MATRIELLRESRRRLSVSAPKLVIHIAVAALIWVFGQFVFVPLAQTFALFGYELAPIVSAIVIVALLIVLLRAAFALRDTADALAGVAAVSVSKSTTEDIHVQNYQKGFRGILYVVYAVVIFLLFYAFLAAIHPVAAGLVLIALVIWSIIVLFQVGGVFSSAIEEWSGRWVQRVGDRLEAGERGIQVSAPEASAKEGKAESARKRTAD